jgi:hypothetical protein
VSSDKQLQIYVCSVDANISHYALLYLKLLKKIDIIEFLETRTQLGFAILFDFSANYIKVKLNATKLDIKHWRQTVYFRDILTRLLQIMKMGF